MNSILRPENRVAAQIVLSLALLVAGRAAAIPLPPLADVNWVAQAGNTYNPGPPTGGTIFAGEPCDFFAPGCFGSSVMTTELVPSPSMEASAHGQNGGRGTGTGFIRYYFSVVGPAGVVPIRVQGSARVSGSGVYQSQAEVAVLSSTGTLLGGGTACANAYISCTPAGALFYDVVRRPSVTLDRTISVTATDPAAAALAEYYTIIVAAYADAGGDGSASAIADPILFFEPGFDASQYQIVVSQGIGVPEPSSAALLGVTAVAGALTRRRRAKSSR